jgi:hypothetical protein
MRGSLEARALIGWYLSDDRLVAAIVVGQPPELQEEINVLLRARARVADRIGLTDPDATPLEVFEST